MVKQKKNLIRLVLNVPPKTAAILEYLVSVSQDARSKSDLVVRMLNDYIDERRETLNDNSSWRIFVESFDKKKISKVEEILEKYTNGESDLNKLEE